MPQYLNTAYSGYLQFVELDAEAVQAIQAVMRAMMDTTRKMANVLVSQSIYNIFIIITTK